jgi:hypothetical protein
MPGETKVLTVGANASALDIFINAGGSPVNATFVGFELFDASNTSATSGVAVNPSTGKYTASGVVPAGFQLGTWRVDWDIITAGNSIVTASEPFCVQEVDVQIGFVPPTDKTGTIYEAVRIDIGDPDGNVFDDDFLKRVLTKAARRLNHRLGLSTTARPLGIPGTFGGPRLKVSPITVDLEAGTITPNNDELCDLIIMMMEYIIITSEVSALKRLAATSASGPFATLVGNAVNDGISVTNADGVRVDISGGRLANRVALHRLDIQTREKELEAAIKAFLARQTGNYGKLIY